MVGSSFVHNHTVSGPKDKGRMVGSSAQPTRSERVIARASIDYDGDREDDAGATVTDRPPAALGDAPEATSQMSALEHLGAAPLDATKQRSAVEQLGDTPAETRQVRSFELPKREEAPSVVVDDAPEAPAVRPVAAPAPSGPRAASGRIVAPEVPSPARPGPTPRSPTPASTTPPLAASPRAPPLTLPPDPAPLFAPPAPRAPSAGEKSGTFDSPARGPSLWDRIRWAVALTLLALAIAAVGGYFRLDARKRAGLPPATKVSAP